MYCTCTLNISRGLLDKAELVLCGVCGASVSVSCASLRVAWGAELALAGLYGWSHIDSGPAACKKIIVMVKAMGINVRPDLLRTAFVDLLLVFGACCGFLECDPGAAKQPVMSAGYCKYRLLLVAIVSLLYAANGSRGMGQI